MTEVEIEMMGLQAKEYQGFQATPEVRRKGMDQILSYRLQRERGPTNTLISDF